MSNSTTDYTIGKFLISNQSVMKSAIDVLQILDKNNKITIKGKGETCPATVSVSNIITQTMLTGIAKTEKISVDSEMSDDGRMISTIEIIIIKTNNQ